MMRGAFGLSLAGLAIFAAVPALARPRAVVYVGHTSQRPRRYGPQVFPGNQVTFHVVGSRVVDFTIPWVAPCVANQGFASAPLIDRSGLDPLPLRHGHFDIRGAGYKTASGYQQTANVQLEIHGRLHGRTATGTLAVVASINMEGLYTSDYCQTRRPVRWRATLR